VTAEFPRTTWARAQAGYDDEFKRHLIAEIVNAIAKASLVTDANVMAIRTGETTEALTSCLISFAAMSPYFDTPSHLREFAEDIAKRIRREVAKARAEGIGTDFIFGARKGGTA
jgi:hypothetical protein